MRDVMFGANENHRRSSRRGGWGHDDRLLSTMDAKHEDATSGRHTRDVLGFNRQWNGESSGLP